MPFYFDNPTAKTSSSPTTLSAWTFYFDDPLVPMYILSSFFSNRNSTIFSADGIILHINNNNNRKLMQSVLSEVLSVQNCILLSPLPSGDQVYDNPYTPKTFNNMQFNQNLIALGVPS